MKQIINDVVAKCEVPSSDGGADPSDDGGEDEDRARQAALRGALDRLAEMQRRGERERQQRDAALAARTASCTEPLILRFHEHAASMRVGADAVGRVSFARWGSTLWIDRFDVYPPVRRRGYGARAFELIVPWAVEEGFLQVAGVVAPDLPELLAELEAFYRDKCGCTLYKNGRFKRRIAHGPLFPGSDDRPGCFSGSSGGAPP